MTRLLTPQQVAELCNVNIKTVYRNYAKWGLKPHPHFGHLLRFSETDVNNFIERTNK